MPLQQNLGSYTFGGKTHTNLIVSEGAAPAEKWIVSKEEKVKFTYEFGPEGNQNVLLAKGKIVELGDAEYDRETERQVSTIKTATEGSKKAVGVLHHNVYETQRDRLSGGNQNNPVVVTRSYIEVPLFEHETLATASDFASAMGFGAAYGDTATKIQPGDFVKVGADGNFVKLDVENDSPFEIVGQALAVERELPPAGFLQYYMDMEIDQLEEFLKTQSFAPSPGSDATGAYPMGYPYSNKTWKTEYEKLLNPTINKGIPFLTDGYFAAKQTVTGIKIDDIYNASTNNDGHIERVDVQGKATVTGSTITVGAGDHKSAVFVKLRHDIDKGAGDAITVKYTVTEGGNPVVKTMSGKDVHVDLKHNVVVIYPEAGATLTDVSIDAKLVVNPIAGIPTEWDYAGSVGAVRILLQR